MKTCSYLPGCSISFKDCHLMPGFGQTVCRGKTTQTTPNNDNGQWHVRVFKLSWNDRVLSHLSPSHQPSLHPRSPPSDPHMAVHISNHRNPESLHTRREIGRINQEYTFFFLSFFSFIVVTDESMILDPQLNISIPAL